MVEDFFAVYFLFSLLAEWKETRAYRPMARLLRCDSDFVDELLSDGITETVKRFMANVFDGDLTVLFDIITDEKADEYARGSMVQTLAIIGHYEPDHLTSITQFLKKFATSHFSEAPEIVWTKWAEAIAFLGLVELKPLVRHIFAAELITPLIMSFSNFERDLELALNPEVNSAPILDGYFEIQVDTLDEIIRWQEQERKDQSSRSPTSGSQFTRSQRDWISPKLGRNDPCPCGSGRKYKKCCLGES